MNQISVRIAIWSIAASLVLPSLVLWHGMNPVLVVVICAALIGVPWYCFATGQDSTFGLPCFPQ